MPDWRLRNLSALYALMSGIGARPPPRNVPRRSADRTIADPPTDIGGGRICPEGDLRLPRGEGRRGVASCRSPLRAPAAGSCRKWTADEPVPPLGQSFSGSGFQSL